MSPQCEMYSVETVVSSYIIALLGDPFEMYRNVKSLCCVPGTNIVL